MEIRDTIVLDKDETICSEDVFFPGIAEFLTRQREKFRRCVVATTGSREAWPPIGELGSLMDSFYGREDLWVLKMARILPNGKIFHPANKTFLKRFFSRFLSTPYRNPHSDFFHTKDLHFLRRLLAGRKFESLRMVLVSDAYDVDNLASDPKTPQVLVMPKGMWLQRKRVDHILDVFFSDGTNHPHEIFDDFLVSGKGQSHGCERYKYPNGFLKTVTTVRKAIASVGGIPFTLAITHCGGRIIYEDPNPPQAETCSRMQT